MKLRSRLVGLIVLVVMLVGAPWAMADAAPQRDSSITLGRFGICIPWGSARVCF